MWENLFSNVTSPATKEMHGIHPKQYCHGVGKTPDEFLKLKKVF